MISPHHLPDRLLLRFLVCARINRPWIVLRIGQTIIRHNLDGIFRAGDLAPVARRTFFRVSRDGPLLGLIPSEDIDVARPVALLTTGAFVAKAIHNLGSRKGGPFIPVNIAAIPAELVASELFGHEKGLSLGLTNARRGGSSWPTEEQSSSMKSEISPLRSKLSSSGFSRKGLLRVGNAQPMKSDFRVVAATNKNLAAEVEKGHFRQDLFYRLDVFPIQVPPLRERKEDTPELVRYFVEKFCRKLGKRVTRIPREEMKKLIDHAWPGNVRELEHRIEQALILADGNTISFPDRVQPYGSRIQQAFNTEIMTLEDMERAYIERILIMTRWRVMGQGGAASVLGMKPTTLFSKMKKLGIKRTNGAG
jgi:formate hydrogenlyase transcriptional activator